MKTYTFKELKAMSRSELIKVYNQNAERVNKQVTRAKAAGYDINQLRRGYLFNDERSPHYTPEDDVKRHHRATVIKKGNTNLTDQQLLERIMTLQGRDYTTKTLKEAAAARQRYMKDFGLSDIDAEDLERMQALEKMAKSNFSEQWYQHLQQWAKRHGYSSMRGSEDMKKARDIMRERQSSVSGSREAVQDLTRRNATIDEMTEGKVDKGDYAIEEMGKNELKELMKQDRMKAKEIRQKLDEILKTAGRMEESAIRDIFRKAGNTLLRNRY